LAPLASPKPSAGQFYLDHHGWSIKQRLTTNEQRPGYAWGSPLDDGPDGPRRISGRKFYWRTNDPLREPSRGRRRKHQSEELSRGTVTLIEAGAVFTARVRFDNLGVVQVGSLVAAIDPRRVWPDTQVVTSVGGGRPFGFGSVRIGVDAVRLERPRARYLGEDGDAPTLAECVAAFLEPADPTDPDTASPQCRQIWPDLRAALTFGKVPDEAIWYPAGPGQKGDEDFDHAYEFFAQTRGQTVSVPRGQGQVEDRPIIPLPSPHEPAGRQRVQPKVTRRQGDSR
jgi:hypothetical protein